MLLDRFTEHFLSRKSCFIFSFIVFAGIKSSLACCLLKNKQKEHSLVLNTFPLKRLLLTEAGRNKRDYHIVLLNLTSVSLNPVGLIEAKYCRWAIFM